MSQEARLHEAIAGIPPGAWAVGVSGGADSVALLGLARQRAELVLHVVHLDHQTRGPHSTGDAEFVAQLAAKWGLAFTLARREQIEPLRRDWPANPSARYRALRLALFRQVVQGHRLAGVILAHHADDQAETVLQRLLRGSDYVALGGMAQRTIIGGSLILRPLLSIRREELRAYLATNQMSWREDASNQSPEYLRNRLRRLLVASSPAMSERLIELGQTCAALRQWARSAAPLLEERFSTATLARLPAILAAESARRWLIDRGMPAEHVQTEAIRRLIAMASDAATPARQDFPGPMRVCRRAGVIRAG